MKKRMKKYIKIMLPILKEPCYGKKRWREEMAKKVKIIRNWTI